MLNGLLTNLGASQSVSLGCMRGPLTWPDLAVLEPEAPGDMSWKSKTAGHLPQHRSPAHSRSQGAAFRGWGGRKRKRRRSKTLSCYHGSNVCATKHPLKNGFLFLFVYHQINPGPMQTTHGGSRASREKPPATEERELAGGQGHLSGHPRGHPAACDGF